MNFDLPEDHRLLLLAEARAEEWEVLRFERLGRRVNAVVGLLGAALAGGAGSAALAARARRSSLRATVPQVRRGRKWMPLKVR